MISLVLLLALQASALDRAEVMLEAERFEEALAQLEDADKAHARYRELRDRAVRGVARDLQRRAGYAEAMRFLEPRLESRAIVDHYTEVCIWAGEEQHALERIGRLDGEAQAFTRFAQVQLHWAQLDFAAMARVAQEAGWADWAEYARAQAALRTRFRSRAERGWWVALWAALAMGGGSMLLARRAAVRIRVRDAFVDHGPG